MPPADRIFIVIHPEGLDMSAEELARVFKAGMGRGIVRPSFNVLGDRLTPRLQVEGFSAAC